MPRRTRRAAGLALGLAIALTGCRGAERRAQPTDEPVAVVTSEEETSSTTGPAAQSSSTTTPTSTTTAVAVTTTTHAPAPAAEPEVVTPDLEDLDGLLDDIDSEIADLGDSLSAVDAARNQGE